MAASVLLLPLPGGARDEHQPALFGRNLLQHRGQPKLVEGSTCTGITRRTMPMRAPLLEHVAAETAEPRHAIGEIDLLWVLELLAVRRWHDGRGHLGEVVMVQLAARLDRLEMAMHAGHSGAARP